MPSNRSNLVRLLDLGVTALRWYGARFRARNTDTARLAACKAAGPKDVFYIVGPGGTLNDLSDNDKQLINTGTSAAVNMAILAPLDFRLCSLEAVLEKCDELAIAGALRKKSRSPVLWFQHRTKYNNDHIKAIEREFDLYRYNRASVSVRRDLATFRLILRHFMIKRIIVQPDLSVCFAVCGSVARLVLLALSLGYRRICFAGVDLGSTQYFWIDQDVGALDLSKNYQGPSLGAMRQGGSGAVPNIFEFIEAISEQIPDVEFKTLDPRNRSRLSSFLVDLRAKKETQNLTTY